MTTSAVDKLRAAIKNARMCVASLDERAIDDIIRKAAAVCEEVDEENAAFSGRSRGAYECQQRILSVLDGGE